MSEVHCDVPAPSLYRNIMHYSHIVTVPVYVAVLIVLVLEKSKEFVRYKRYLIAHVLLNLVNEIYICYMMLPVTYLPHPLIRTTGWMAQWGFSGLVQYFFMVQFILFNGMSIMKMMFFRFKMCILNYHELKFYVFVKWMMRILRGLVFGHILLAFTWPGDSEEKQRVEKTKIYEQYAPSVPPEILCYSAVIVNLDAVVSKVILASYIIMAAFSCILGHAMFLYIVVYIKHHVTSSARGLRMQKILIVSLFIQGTVHSGLITIPCIVEGLTVFSNFQYNTIGMYMFSMVAFHGFASTCAMMIFTKPIRDGFMFWRKPRRNSVVPVTAVSRQVM